jgi:hypothetical protein
MIDPAPIYFSLSLGIVGFLILFIGVYIWKVRHTRVS